MEFIEGSESQNGMVLKPTEIVAPRRLNPFPYANYFIDGDLPNPDINSIYNDPALDAVTLKVVLGGDPTAWSDINTYVDLGLLTPSQAIDPLTAYYASGALYYPSTDTLDAWGYSQYFIVDDAVQKLRYSWAQQGLSSPGAQTVYLPGVASLNSYTYIGYSSVTYKGSPVWFELEFQQNNFKSNPNLYYSGYTNFGDFTGFGEQGLVINDPYVPDELPGYMRRYVSGIIKKDADLETCTVDDIICGTIWTSQDLGGGVYDGVGYIVVNGVIKGTITSSSKPKDVDSYLDPITDSYAIELGDNPQYWNGGLELDVNSGFVFSEPAFPAAAFDALDVYDVKFAWYIDFVTDPGDPSLSVEFTMPMMYTHPGYYFD